MPCCLQSVGVCLLAAALYFAHACTGQKKAPHTERLLALLLRRAFPPVSSRGTKGEKEYRAAAVQYYCDQEYDPKMVLTDMLTGARLPAEQIVAAHIYRKQWDYIKVLTHR